MKKKQNFWAVFEIVLMVMISVTLINVGANIISYMMFSFLKFVSSKKNEEQE